MTKQEVKNKIKHEANIHAKLEGISREDNSYYIPDFIAGATYVTDNVREFDLFTRDRVAELLKQQRGNCADAVCQTKNMQGLTTSDIAEKAIHASSPLKNI